MITNILGTIGNTPLIKLNNIYAKLECFNPTGSIKDRIAKYMLLRHTNTTNIIVEASSGNTGISVAFVASALGLASKIFCPINTSKLKIKLMKEYGANVINSAKDMPDAVKLAQEYCKQNTDTVYLNQFNNIDNINAQMSMATEIKQQIDVDIDAIISGVGTGGTLMGLHNIFPEAQIIQVIPTSYIEGITDYIKSAFIPRDLHIIQYAVSKVEAVLSSSFLAKQYGLHCGLSSGANFYIAARLHKKYKHRLTVFPDSGWRYFEL